VGNLTLKIYDKDALRIEVVVHNAKDLRGGKVLEKLRGLLERSAACWCASSTGCRHLISAFGPRRFRALERTDHTRPPGIDMRTKAPNPDFSNGGTEHRGVSLKSAFGRDT
jgi:hypothetical protein